MKRPKTEVRGLTAGGASGTGKPSERCGGRKTQDRSPSRKASVNEKDRSGRWAGVTGAADRRLEVAMYL